MQQREMKLEFEATDPNAFRSKLKGPLRSKNMFCLFSHSSAEGETFVRAHLQSYLKAFVRTRWFCRVTSCFRSKSQSGMQLTRVASSAHMHCEITFLWIRRHLFLKIRFKIRKKQEKCLSLRYVFWEYIVGLSNRLLYAEALHYATA